jgi:uncharacterized membrane protein YsdA (DUF1294 family)
MRTYQRNGPGHRTRRSFRIAPGSLFLSIAGGSAAILTAVLVLRGSLPFLIAYLASINAVDFGLYGCDKWLAKMGWLRVPEKTLHLVDLAGGTPGGFAAQSLFRHKTAKMSFRRIFWLIAAAQAVLIGWAVWYFLIRR